MSSALKKENRPLLPDTVPLDGLSPRQAQALELLLQGKSITRTAQSLGIARSTLSEWFNNNARFVACYTLSRRVAFESMVNRLVSLSSEALNAMEEGLKDPERRYQTGKFLLKLATSSAHVERDPKREDETLLQADLYKLLFRSFSLA